MGPMDFCVVVGVSVYGCLLSVCVAMLREQFDWGLVQAHHSLE